MGNRPLFSVIIPTFNREITILRAVNSVLNQTFKNFELIVVDDGSTDRTKKLLENLPINYFKIENHGVSFARNFGVKKSQAEWIAFLDSDDEWESDKLERQAQFIELNPNTEFIHTNESWIKNEQIIIQKSHQQKGGGDQFARSCQACLISPSTVALKRSLYDQYQGFREDYPVCEDYDLWLKVTSDMPVGYIDLPLNKKYAGHGDQLSMKFKAMDFWRVKSLDWILQHKKLTVANYEIAKLELIKKAQILLNGYKKHGRGESAEFQEIHQIFNYYSS